MGVEFFTGDYLSGREIRLHRISECSIHSSLTNLNSRGYSLEVEWELAKFQIGVRVSVAAPTNLYKGSVMRYSIRVVLSVEADSETDVKDRISCFIRRY